MRRWLRAATIAGVVAGTALVVAVAAATAGTTQVSGVGEFDTSCVPPPAAGGVPADLGDYPPMELEGSLVGCWYTYVSDAKAQPSGTYLEKGTETFVGCLNETTCGTFTTTYTFTGKFAPSGAEIHGRCEHSIVGGTGGFDGVSGVINFKDDVDAGLFFYRGNIHS
jgi:hypothetical protein